ncbi:glycosyltransferase family 4 protein [Phenylobacterium deserti]|uniref:Glycosyltransferase WbuB n=1 Tax=Phenylobacterium deserti TaxID=1914756 RepID=A0A328ADC3_9CAUL|nr:glycosyltransferase family 4 protein [Phenylobacterium deserti]RAK52640.1 glycosyltransferase WbuB [Phenylobacterium deserti]
MRIAIHDYAGHPFVFELSRQLAREGHQVGHFFFEGDPGPKGATERKADDPETLQIFPIAISEPYRKDQLLKRRSQDIEYGRKAGAEIAAFRPDVILSGNTPLESQAPLMAAARRAGAGFVFWMQDFYSLAVRNLLSSKFFGAGGLAALWYERLEATLLNRSDAIVVISDDFLAGLKQLKVDAQDVEIIPNWGALNEIPLRPKANAWSERMGLTDSYVFLYSGTLGLKHDPMMLCALADAFQDDPAVKVVVSAVGAGAEFLRLELDSNPRPNLLLKGLEPIEALPDALGAADTFVALLEEDAGRYSVPSKVLSYLCAGKPALLSAPLENLSARMLTQAGAGRAIRAGDTAALIAAARELRNQPLTRQRMGDAGRAYAIANFDMAAVSRRFMAVFDDVLARQPAAAVAA